MKSTLLTLIFIIVGCTGYTQETISRIEDQNPNHKRAMDAYSNNSQDYIIQQGTTLQQTYKAIDPLEEKRELRSLKSQYRSQRAYWRHQRRAQRIENTRYHNYGYSGNRGYGYDLLGLGILGACLFW